MTITIAIITAPLWGAHCCCEVLDMCYFCSG